MFIKVLSLVTLFAVINGQTLSPLILMGGNADGQGKTEIYQEFIRRAGSNGAAKLCFITVAADNPESEKDKFMEEFKALNVNSDSMFWLNVNKDDSSVANNPELVGIAEACNGYFFSGGVQFRNINALLEPMTRRDTQLMKVIRNNFNNGKAVVAGTNGAKPECQTSLGKLIAGTYRCFICNLCLTYEPGVVFLYIKNSQ